ncbi:MAG: hypothetical protein PHP54_04050 [Clostridia bacterium]|nr:hypothetical protein [Clostridia bacterium]
MIFDLLNSFGEYFKDTKVVMDSYRLQNGIYLLFKNDGTHEMLKIDKDTNTTTTLYEYLKIRDFYSNYMDSNKALDTSYIEEYNGKEYKMVKKICSNNQYTLFFKNRFVEGLINDNKETIPVPIFLKGIDKYFDSMISLGKNDRKVTSIMEEIKDIVSSEQEILEKKELLKENFLKAVEIVKDETLTKDIWVKIFLEAEEIEYERATLKYLCTKIFNKNDANIQQNGNLYGINNYNFGYTTAKKPFIELKSTPFKVASKLSLEEIKMVRNLYIWLLKNVSTKDFVKIPVDYNFTSELDKIDIKQKAIYLLRVLNDNGSAKIDDFSFIPFYTNTIREFKCTNCFHTKVNLEESEFVTKDSYELENRVSKIWFANSLKDSYYRFKDIVSKRTMIPNWKKELLKEKATIFFEFFHKANDIPIKQNLDSIAYHITLNNLIDEIKEDKIFHTMKSMNLWFAFDEYFGGDFKMIKNQIYTRSKEVVLQEGTIDSDEMYFFFVGQVVKYLLDKSKASNKTQSMIDSVMKAGTQEKLIHIILLLRDKYSHELRLVNPKFDNILKQIVTDTVEKDVVKNRKYILAGFLENNLFYLKSKKENDTENLDSIV